MTTEHRMPSAVVSRWLDTWWPNRSRNAVPTSGRPVAGCAVLGWAGSGGMALTGVSSAPPLISPAAAYGVLDAAVGELGRLTGIVGDAVHLEPGAVIGARAALRGLRGNGQISAGGMTRLIRAADRWIAISLCRPDDVASVPAIVGDQGTDDPWRDLADFAARTPASAVVAQAQLLGVAAAELGRATDAPSALPFQVTDIASRTDTLAVRGATVVDLSSLWAGPLCGGILSRAGARVIKVESTGRPDGARIGDPEFFEWLHRGQEFRAIDFTSDEGRNQLAHLIDAADIVIEASRPRALERLGLSPDRMAHRPGRIWVSITGGGRSRPMQVNFGDDAAVGGGLVGWNGDQPAFCADAIADPLSGIAAALATAAAAESGGGVLIDLSMVDTVASFTTAELACPGDHVVHDDGDGDWVAECSHERRRCPVRGPTASGLPC
ncbi:CoA transferase [Streptomyces sp. SID6673]|nr:CoA transferase [Streptomyces sp. SID11726]NEB27111.1 CoA transferase [Streptomyces sp. SID6673]